MKKYITGVLCVLMFVVFSTSVYADVFVKQKSHTAGYYYGGVNNPAVDFDVVTWIGDKKMAVITDNRMVILDTETNQGFFVNKRNKTYAQTTLPMDLANLVPEGLANYLKNVKYIGSVKETGETKAVGKYKCKGYKVNSYVYYQESKVNETDSTVWTSTKVPFNLETWKGMNLSLQKIRNLGDKLMTDLEKVKGFPIFTESSFYPKGFSVKTTTETVEMSVKKPPAGTYAVPEGFKKIDKLTIQDLRSR
jgi:hypothetical protein